MAQLRVEKRWRGSEAHQALLPLEEVADLGDERGVLQPVRLALGLREDLDGGCVLAGLVVGLGYANPYLHPFEEMQRLKTHPAMRGFFEGGRRLAYGARALTAGGLQSLPKTVFPGGVLVGDDAGYLNAARIKGSHAALKSGMLAAESAFEALAAGRERDELGAYPEAFRKSWLHEELHLARNFRYIPGLFSRGAHASDD